MLAWLRRLRRDASTPKDDDVPDWSAGDSEPIGEAYGRPDRVRYELRLATHRYSVQATFCNRDPWAESDESVARQEYEVRRSPEAIWEVRLIGRNLRPLDTPEAWQPAPERFVKAWESAWQRRRSA